jgi:hypothetical protein
MLRKALEIKREFTTNHTDITNKTGFFDKKFVVFVWLVVKFLELRNMSYKSEASAEYGIGRLPRLPPSYKTAEKTYQIDVLRFFGYYRGMRLRLLPKIAVLSFLYMAAFLFLVCLQFSRQTSFSRRVGNFVVSGQMREPTEGSDSGSRNDYLINEYAKISFGGLDFMLSNDVNNPLLLVEEDGSRAPLIVDTLNISNDTAHFLLSDGAELVFYTQKSADTDGLLISGILPEKATALYLPYLPAPFAKVNTDDVGHWKVSADNVNFMFDRQPESGTGRQLVLSRDDPIVFYHAEPEAVTFNPVSFIVRGGMERIVYEEQLKQWGDKVYSAWENSPSLTNDEMFVTVFLAEAARRGAYLSAAAESRLQPFGISSAQTYLSAPFLGRLDVALRTLSAAESAQSARLSELVETKSPRLLTGDPFFKAWTFPLGSGLIKAQGVFADGIALSGITLADTIGILEGCEGWSAYAPNTENPFARFVLRSLELIGERLIKDSGQSNVFVMDGGRIDVEFNVRLGLALAAYGDRTGAPSWAGVGRSLVLSVLALTDDAGLLPAFLTVDENKQIKANSTAEKINTAQLYPFFPLAAYYPHAVDLGYTQPGVWVWTASPGVTAVFQNNVLDISISFPVGWTHHLLVRGVPPFTKIQLRDMDYRSDPRFEQYNSPGWVYSASAQTLLIKMAHRSEEEHIRIFY